ncbi:MAG: hypothetical protein E7498_08865 [Ruminococcus sp.]|nr:hypothetical protein [Ruminococcus sp.]MBQ7026787.1 hypothetical protein [Ruminococcus sp.]
MDIVIALIIIAGGIFSIIGAVRNRDRFMDNYKARRYVRIFGRNGARVSYVIRGVFLIIVGITFVILFRF